MIEDIFLFIYTMWAFYGNLWAKEDLLSESPPIWEPLPPRVDSPNSLRLWPGFEPTHLGIPQPPQHVWFHCTTVAFILAQHTGLQLVDDNIDPLGSFQTINISLDIIS